MKLKTESVLRFGVGLTLAAGIGWTAINILRSDDFTRKMQVKLDTIKQLQEMKRQNDRIESSFASLAAVSNAAPSLSDLASATVTGATAEIRELDSRALGRGWNAKRMEVVFHEVSLSSIGIFLRTAETNRPPWRLSECAITASKKADGNGTVKLIMETVKR